MRGKEGSKMTSLPKISWLDQGQLERVVRLEKLPAFKGLVTTVESSEVCYRCTQSALWHQFSTLQPVARNLDFTAFAFFY